MSQMSVGQGRHNKKFGLTNRADARPFATRCRFLIASLPFTFAPLPERGLTPLLKWVDLRPKRSNRALFLDRDGVLNRRVVGGYVLSKNALEINCPLIDALKPIARLGVPIAIVSNQSCVGKGLIAPSEMRALMEHFTSTLNNAGVPLSAWYCCPHRVEDKCLCRKPAPGMFFAAAADLDIDLCASCIICDSLSDLAAGAAAGLPRGFPYAMGENNIEPLVQELGRFYGN